MENRPKFQRVRVQMVYPCAAKCRWCRTYLKNPNFTTAWRTEETQKVNEFYLDVVRRYKPERMYLSGGEALSMPGINDFVKRALKHCEKICIYTSYQYSPVILQKLQLDGIDPRRVILTHSIIHFLPEQWDYLTRGFPHDIYVKNILLAKDSPFIKRVKFVINHEDRVEEVKYFMDRIKPDDKFQLSFKLMNEQNNGFGAAVMTETKEQVREQLKSLDVPLMSVDRNVAKGVEENKIIENCEYRKGPVELRFAYYKQTDDGIILKTRFCSYFGRDTYHKFHVGKDKLRKIDKWYNEGTYRTKCDSCRLLYYE